MIRPTYQYLDKLASDIVTRCQYRGSPYRLAAASADFLASELEASRASYLGDAIRVAWLATLADVYIPRADAIALSRAGEASQWRVAQVDDSPRHGMIRASELAHCIGVARVATYLETGIVPA